MRETLLFFTSLRKTYRLYIGDGDLMALKHFIDGYVTCLQRLHRPGDMNIMDDWVAFMEEHVPSDRSSRSVFEKLQEKAGSTQEAFAVFFDLLDQFLLDSHLDS